MIQQLDASLWSEVRASVQAGRDAAAEALDAGAPRELCLAADTTLAVLGSRQDHIEAQAFGTGGASAETLPRLERQLRLVEGRLPQTTILRVETLFELGQDALAQQTLAHGLVQWPAEARLHEQALAWIDILPDPAVLAAQLEERVGVLGLADPDSGGIALETAGRLHEEVGKRLYALGDQPAAAASAFREASTVLARSRSLPRALSDEEVDLLRTDISVSETYGWLQDALNRWYENGPDDEQAGRSAALAEEAVQRALDLRPSHEAARQAVLWVGDALMTRGGGDAPRPGDLAAMRDFYGRMAKRYDVSAWWNNYAFWCRETGTATEQAGDAKAAMKLYEASYDAYRNAIRLEPDNSRLVNDTGLMLLYHLGRDLDEAERLFLRSWELGKAVCENPFVEQDVYDQNLSAYGDAMLNLARLYQMQGKLERAAEIADELLEVAPERLDARMTRVEIQSALDAREG